MCSPGTISAATIRSAGQPSCSTLRASAPTVTSQGPPILENSRYSLQQDPASNNIPPLLSPRASAFGYPERRAMVILQHIACSGILP